MITKELINSYTYLQSINFWITLLFFNVLRTISLQIFYEYCESYPKKIKIKCPRDSKNFTNPDTSLSLVKYRIILLFFYDSNFNNLSAAILGIFMLKILITFYVYFNQFPLNVHILPLAHNLLQWLNNAEEERKYAFKSNFTFSKLASTFTGDFKSWAYLPLQGYSNYSTKFPRSRQPSIY